MDMTKPWYQSQTIIANIVVVLGLVLSFFKVDFGVADQAALVQTILALGTGIAAIWGIVGRIVATSKIG